MLLFSCGNAHPNLFSKLFRFAVGMDMDPFIRLSTESDMIPRIYELASPTSFKASTLSMELTIIHFLKSKSFSYSLRLVEKPKSNLEW